MLVYTIWGRMQFSVKKYIYKKEGASLYNSIHQTNYRSFRKVNVYCTGTMRIRIYVNILYTYTARFNGIAQQIVWELSKLSCNFREVVRIIVVSFNVNSSLAYCYFFFY